MATVVGRSSDRANARRAGDLLRWAIGAVDDGRAPTRTTSEGVPPRPTQPPSAAGLDDLTDRAEYHRITPIVHAVAGRIPDLDPAVGASLEASYHYAVRRHLFILDDLAWVIRVLGDLAPDVLVIKGPVLSSTVYARPDLRSYGDLDIVVRTQAFRRAVELLTDAGATFCEPDWATVVGRRHGEVALALPSGTVVDLHWHLIPLGNMRDRFTVPMATIFDEARTVSIDGRPYRTLTAEDTIVHLALHAVLCGGDRLGWLVDLHQALHPATGDAPDLDSVVATARSWGAIGALAGQLERLGRVRAPVVAADAALTSTTARVARTATALADRIQPPERSTGARTVGVALAWAAAPTLAASAAELTRMGARWARGQSDDHGHVGENGRPMPPPTPRQWQDYLATVPSG